MSEIDIAIKTTVDKALADMDKAQVAVKGLSSAGEAAAGGLSNMEKALAKSRTTISGLDKDISIMGKNIGSGADFMHALGINIPITPMAAFGQVTAAAGQFLGDAVATAMDYNKAMLDLATAIGTTTEEASRIVQVADDVGISQEKITKAMELMAKNGISPSIDAIATLADQFNSYTDPAQRAADMSKIFGRNWAEIAPLLSKGGGAIREASAAVEDSLVVTEASIKKTEAYRLAVDRLTDRWEAFKVSLGTDVAAPIADTLDKIDKQSRRLAEWKIQNPGKSLMFDFSGSWAKFNEAQDVIDATNRRWSEYDDAVKKAYGITDSSAAGISAALSEIVDPMDEVTLSMQKYSDQLLFAQASQGLSADAARALAQNMGLIDDTTTTAMAALDLLRQSQDDGKDSAAEYALKVGILRDTLDRLDGKSVSVEILMQMVAETIAAINSDSRSYNKKQKWGGHDPEDPDYKPGGKAAGGPVTGYTPYIVGELGPELFVPQSNGTIVPNSELGGKDVIAAVESLGRKLDNMPNMLARAVRDAMLQISK